MPRGGVLNVVAGIVSEVDVAGATGKDGAEGSVAGGVSVVGVAALEGVRGGGRREAAPKRTAAFMFFRSCGR